MSDTADKSSPRTGDATHLAGVAELYRQNLETYGTSSRSVGWKDDSSHRLRFDKLAELVEPGTDAFTVNDLGCGYASLLGYLDEIRPGRAARYYGYDICRAMLDAARSDITDDRAEFIEAGVLRTPADYSFVSGSFNVRLETGEDDWRDHVLRSLDNLAAFSRRGFAFNLLSTYVDWKQDDLYYGDPLFFFDHCKRNYSRAVTLLHDYPLYEWTILVRLGND